MILSPLNPFLSTYPLFPKKNKYCFYSYSPMSSELGTEQFSFKEFLKKAEEKRIDPLVAEKFFEQKLLEGKIILKPNKMYQNIP